MLLTMQAFYTQLCSAHMANDAYLACLARLTHANREQLSAFDIDWLLW